MAGLRNTYSPAPTESQHLPGFTQVNESVYLCVPGSSEEDSLLLHRDRLMNGNHDELPLTLNQDETKPWLSQSTTSLTTSTKSLSTNAPDVILLLTWGSAPLRLIAKYTARYISLFPTTPIILIRTSFTQMWTHSTSSQSLPLSPVIDALSSIFSNLPHTSPKVLVHVWSNGGAYKLRELAREYKIRRGSILPITKLIFDSAPAKLQVLQGTNATAHAFPKIFLIRYILWGITFVLLAMLKVIAFIRRRHELVTQVWWDVNDAKLIDETAERAYFYSKQDQVVGYEDVVKHIVNARQRGWKVESVEFEGSGHVQHALKFGERYWSTVQRVWEEGAQTKYKN